jgi:hypothetical protein
VAGQRPVSKTCRIESVRFQQSSLFKAGRLRWD